MSNLYDMLCVVRTSVLNVIGQMYLEGKPKNLAHILESIGDEINTRIDFIDGLLEMSQEQLYDLGFDFLNEESYIMLFPAWLYPFIPDGAKLIDIEGNVFIQGNSNEVVIYNDSWVNVGIDIVTICENGTCTTYRNINGGCDACGESSF